MALSRSFLIAGTALFVSAAAFAQSGAIKMNPGLWEHTFSMKSDSGEMEKAMKEMQKAMASLPPEQRRQMEAMMGNQGAVFGAQGNSVKVCVSKEEAERDQPPPPQDGCTQTAKRSGNVWNVTFKCPGPPASSGDGVVTMQNPGSYTGLINIVTTERGKAEKVQMTTAGKWLGANCGNVKSIKP
jgi:hypothetical protein